MTLWEVGSCPFDCSRGVPVGFAQVTDAFEVKCFQFAESQFVVAIPHDHDNIAIFWMSILVFAKDLPEYSSGMIAFNSVTHPTGRDDSDSPNGRFPSLLNEKL